MTKIHNLKVNLLWIFYCFTDFLHILLYYRFSTYFIVLQIFYICYCFTDVLHILLFYKFSIYFIVFTDFLHNFTVLHIFLIILLFYTFSTYFIILHNLLFCRFSTYFTVLQIFCNLQRFTQWCSKLYISVCIERN